MNRKMIVSLILVVNAMFALSLWQSQAQDACLTSVTVDDGTQPPVPPPGRTIGTLLADGTQPAVPPPGAAVLIADGTQPAVPPPGVAVLIADGTQPAVPPPGRLLETVAARSSLLTVSQKSQSGARLAALVADGTQPPVPPPGLLAQHTNERAA
jgi:hypothetical protein